MPLSIPAPRESGFTATTPASLYWAAYGPAGAPRLLVLHGGPGASHDYLLPQMLALAERYDLLFYDQRGGGRSRSDDDRTPVSWRSHVDDVGAVVRELALDQAPLRIVGYSWGGMLALLYAIQAVGGGRSAVGERGAPTSHLPPPTAIALIDPAPLTRTYREQFEAEFAARSAGPAVRRLRDELAASGMRERDPEGYRQRAFELSVAGYFADPERARDLTPFRVVGRVQQQVWESLGDFDLVRDAAAARLGRSTTSLVVHGREDPIPLASSEAGARALGARLVVLEDWGHVPYGEQPAALFAALGDFLAETDPPAAS